MAILSVMKELYVRELNKDMDIYVDAYYKNIPKKTYNALILLKQGCIIVFQ